METQFLYICRRDREIYPLLTFPGNFNSCPWNKKHLEDSRADISFGSRGLSWPQMVLLCVLCRMHYQAYSQSNSSSNNYQRHSGYYALGDNVTGSLLRKAVLYGPFFILTLWRVKEVQKRVTGHSWGEGITITHQVTRRSCCLIPKHVWSACVSSLGLGFLT